MSSSHLRIEDREAHLTMRCQVLSLLEALDSLDANGDDIVTAEEVELAGPDIVNYLDQHYRIFANAETDDTGGVRLDPESRDVQYLLPGTQTFILDRLGTVDVTLAFRADEPITSVLIESSLFEGTSPDHIDILAVEWSEGSVQHFDLSRDSPRIRIEPGGGGSFTTFFVMGFHHILSGWDHLAFLAALILCARTLRSLLGIVTAFTISHSLTLGLATMDVIDFSAYGSIIEMAIALSIAYVAADNLIRNRKIHNRWIEAFTFGLIHGLGFAGFLGESLVASQSKALALVSFNLGVEGGQILVAVPFVIALRMLPRPKSDDDTFIAPRPVRLPGSAVVLVLGLYWFFQRV